MNKKVLYFLIVCFLALAADYLTKQLVLQSLNEGDSVPVIEGFFSVVLTYNKGMAFGLLNDVSEPWRLPLIGAAITLALVVLILLLFKEYKDSGIGQFGIALILGGALGNILDRLTLGMVVDFLDFYVNQYHWPAFNIADSEVCIGVFLLLFQPLFERGKEQEGSDVSE